MPDITYTTTNTELTSIANAIRQKTGKQGTIEYPAGYVNEIGAISGGGGDSDFSTAEVSFRATDYEYNVDGITSISNDEIITARNSVTPDVGLTVIIPLYKGAATLYAEIFSNIDPNAMPICDGDIELTQEGFKVTGNGSITIKGNQTPL